MSNQYLVEQLGLIAKKETQMPIRSDSGLKWLQFLVVLATALLREKPSADEE